MNLSEIPTPETDAVNSGEWESLEIRYDLMHDLAEKLERRLTVAREALELVKEMHEHEATGDPDRQPTDEGRARHAQAIIEAITLTTPKP